MCDVDFSDAPYGATHWNSGWDNNGYRKWFRLLGCRWYVHQAGWVSLDGVPCCIECIVPIWSPETNTLHTIRLSGEQFARLYEAEIAGGQRFVIDGENAVRVTNHTWLPDAVYQVKTKSEFELFEDRAVKIFGLDTPTEVLKKAFEEGCRFVDIKSQEVE